MWKTIWKITKYLLLLIIVAVLCTAGYYFTKFAPLIGGMGAKTLCSCALVGGKNEQDVVKNELAVFPVSLGNFRVDYSDSSAYGNVLGLFERKAIFRKGFGCTLLSDVSEEVLRDEKLPLPAKAPDSLKQIAWPLGEKVEIRSSPNVDSAQLAKVLDDAFEEQGEKLRRVRAVVVVYDGKIIAEKYTEGYDSSSKLPGWSMSKGIMNGLFGVLVKEGKIDVTARAPIEEWANDDRKLITVDNLLKQSSALDWRESYAGPSHVTNMLFNERDMSKFAIQSKLVGPPGEWFNYSSGTAMILSRIVRLTVGEKQYHSFPYDSFLHKIGMYNTTLELDAGGNFVASSYTFATARDWARFGLLYCNGGEWFGERIFPENWMKYTTTPAKGASIGEYGAQFWLNGGNPNNTKFTGGIFPDAPTDMLWADGFEGQRIFIMPSKKLVIVKLALTRGNHLNENIFIKDIVKCVSNNTDTRQTIAGK